MIQVRRFRKKGAFIYIFSPPAKKRRATKKNTYGKKWCAPKNVFLHCAQPPWRRLLRQTAVLTQMLRINALVPRILIEVWVRTYDVTGCGD